MLRALVGLFFILSVGVGRAMADGQSGVGLPPGSCGTGLWDSGAFDQRTAQTSIVGGYSGDMHTADDVYVQPGELAHVKRVAATLIGQSIVPKARLRIYEDCNGAPSTLLYSQDTVQLTDTGQVYSGLHVYLAEFTLADLWLPGGPSGRTYWVSVSGIAATPTDQWYWASAGAGQITGLPGQYRAPTAGYPNWIGVNELGCGCTDFVLRLEGDWCKELWNNGAPMAPAAGTPSMLGPGSVEARAADDFVVPPCEDVSVCYLEATMYSTCSPLTGRFEIYPNDCSKPGALPLGVVPFSRALDLGYSVIIDGVQLHAYRVQAFEPGLTLPGGQTYWLAAVGQASGSFLQRTLFAWGSDCTRCAVRLNGAVSSGPSIAAATPTTWTTIDQASGETRALGFIIGVKKPDPVGVLSVPPCRVDINQDGHLDVQDLFDFLNAWFAPCP